MFQQIDNVLRLGISKNGVLIDTLAFFNSTTKDIDFHAQGLSKNQSSITTIKDFSSNIAPSGYQNLPGELVIQYYPPRSNNITRTGFSMTSSGYSRYIVQWLAFGN